MLNRYSQNKIGAPFVLSISCVFLKVGLGASLHAISRAAVTQTQMLPTTRQILVMLFYWNFKAEVQI